MGEQRKNATNIEIKKYVDQAMQASVPRTTQTIVIMIALCTDTDPMEVQRSYMDSQFFIDGGFRKLVTGEAARERLIGMNPAHAESYEKKPENDT